MSLRAKSMGSQRVRHNLAAEHTHTYSPRIRVIIFMVLKMTIFNFQIWTEWFHVHFYSRQILQSNLMTVNIVGVGFPGGGKETTCQCRRHKRLRFYPWSGRSPGVASGDPLQYSCLDNSMDRGAWRATVHRAAKSRTLSMHTHTLLEYMYTSKIKLKFLFKFLLEINFYTVYTHSGTVLFSITISL